MKIAVAAGNGRVAKEVIAEALGRVMKSRYLAVTKRTIQHRRIIGRRTSLN